MLREPVSAAMIISAFGPQNNPNLIWKLDEISEMENHKASQIQSLAEEAPSGNRP
jgi:hypothetical protein